MSGLSLIKSILFIVFLINVYVFLGFHGFHRSHVKELENPRYSNKSYQNHIFLVVFGSTLMFFEACMGFIGRPIPKGGVQTLGLQKAERGSAHAPTWPQKAWPGMAWRGMAWPGLA